MVINRKTAKNELLKLISQLENSKQLLSYEDFITILEASKSLYSNHDLINLLVLLSKLLYNGNIEKKETLTNREKHVLILIGNGMQNKAIASKLGLSKHTIETHRKNIRKKLNLNNRDNLHVCALIYSLQNQEPVL
ncbi:response regulator transcription factor [Winogradskyella ursingii]|uniref:response regulator transcription factor n=1 Tax=Winogradskyella ursingii TaxID=2686079 RepID=UPI0015CE5DCE|nr:helix-turn-helix transcriptional regulator [Winogradskyella ursingii]